MQSYTEQNKELVRRFNKEFIEQGSVESFHELISPQTVNHAAPAGSPNGPDSMLQFLQDILRTGFSEIKVEILDQVAELDKVTSRKIIYGVHTGTIMGIRPSGKEIAIHVIDIVRLKDGQYVEHWGMSNISEIIKEISEN